MIFKKTKYIFISFLIALLILPTFCFALSTDSVYVWSNNSNLLTTSTEPNSEEETNTSQTERKFFRYYFWKCNFNGSNNWPSFI